MTGVFCCYFSLSFLGGFSFSFSEDVGRKVWVHVSMNGQSAMITV